MTVRMGLLRKKPEWSSEDFRGYWRDHHGPLAARVPGLRGYWQNAVTDRLQRGIDFERGPWDFDGISQLFVDQVPKADEAFTRGELAARLVADERHFLGDLHIVTAEQNVVVPMPEGAARGKLLKRMSTLRRRADLTEEDFRREWLVHADYVRKMPGVAGYRQNVIVGRERVKGQPCGYEKLAIDGVVELWFEDTGTLEAAFSSPAGQITMKHATTFLAEITAFLVSEHKVI